MRSKAISTQGISSFSSGPVIVQTLVVGLVMLAALLAPPASGSILLLPLHAGQSGAVLRDALAHGARLEGAGPIAGSFVVRAERDRIAPAMLGEGVLMLAAAPLLCGPVSGRPS